MNSPLVSLLYISWYNTIGHLQSFWIIRPSYSSLLYLFQIPTRYSKFLLAYSSFPIVLQIVILDMTFFMIIISYGSSFIILSIVPCVSPLLYMSLTIYPSLIIIGELSKSRNRKFSNNYCIGKFSMVQPVSQTVRVIENFHFAGMVLQEASLGHKPSYIDISRD